PTPICQGEFGKASHSQFTTAIRSTRSMRRATQIIRSTTALFSAERCWPRDRTLTHGLQIQAGEPLKETLTSTETQPGTDTSMPGGRFWVGFAVVIGIIVVLIVFAQRLLSHPTDHVA